MHFYIMFLLMLAFLVAVIYFAKAAVLEFEQQADQDVFKVKGSYLAIIHQKDVLAGERLRLQDETNRIFNLYDLVRELTSTADVVEAFRVFKEHLHRQVVLDDCQLVEHFPEDITAFPSFKGYRFFSLKAKRMSLGEIAYKGLASADEEVFAILAHQFALALRRIRLTQDLEEMAVTDGLTLLHTRRYLTERFQDEFGRAKTKGAALSLLMIDVDLFKRINDQYGHLTGDQVLREVARIIKQHTRGIDITGRYGGEEFCVILPDTDKAGALVAGERIRAAVEAAVIKAFDATLAVSVSVGGATFPDDAHQMDELMDKADWALYRAKKMGRNRVAAFSVYDSRA